MLCYCCIYILQNIFYIFSINSTFRYITVSRLYDHYGHVMFNIALIVQRKYVVLLGQAILFCEKESNWLLSPVCTTKNEINSSLFHIFN